MRNAYIQGFNDRCLGLGVTAEALVKCAQQQGLGSDILNMVIQQPAVRDMATTAVSNKAGEIAKLLKLINVLKTGPQETANIVI